MCTCTHVYRYAQIHARRHGCFRLFSLVVFIYLHTGVHAPVSMYRRTRTRIDSLRGARGAREHDSERRSSLTVKTTSSRSLSQRCTRTCLYRLLDQPMFSCAREWDGILKLSMLIDSRHESFVLILVWLLTCVFHFCNFHVQLFFPDCLIQ